ncbi:hypothetical protein [Arthrobacter sp. D1-17]
MTATQSDRGPQFLRRAGLLAGLLAIIAGIVGMHVLTGPHTIHMAGSTAAVQTHHVVTNQMATESAGHGGHDSHHNPRTIAAGASTANFPAPTSDTFSCIGGDPCAGMSAMGGSCIPSGSTGSLAAPPPATVAFAADSQAPEAAVSGYAYLPESRSPADLCISRT